MYNLTHVPFKLHRFSRGDVLLHNTVVKVGSGMSCFSSQPFEFALFRNNLAIGGATSVDWGGYGAGSGEGAEIRSHGPHCSFDFDAVGSVSAGAGTIGGKPFSLVEPNGLIVDMNVFQSVAFPSEPLSGYQPPDLRPKKGSKIVDRGVALPNVNDGFAGAAPDIGAYELDQVRPVYGPRAPGIDEDSVFKRKLKRTN
jgi:hypothetical protein